VKEKKFQLPNNTERSLVLGRTGSGKTVFAVWLLSMHSIETQPWVILDFKRDSYLRSLPFITKIKLGDLPKKPGIYYLPVKPNEDDDAINDYLFSLLDHGNIGFFCDEASNIPQREPRFRGLKAILAQGRSKKVPVILASQRTAWLNQSIISETEYFAAFQFNQAADKKRLSEFMPDDATETLDDYWSHWYDIKRNAYFRLKPVDEQGTFDRLSERLKPKVRLI